MRRLALLLAGALLIAAALPGVVAAAKPTTGSWTVPVEATGPNGSANGVLEITRFATQGGQVVALGSFTGTITNAAGVSQTGTDSGLAIPVLAASCDILSLTLGPLHLDILGLVVDLNEVHLDITAVPGAGNLLGNLLCSVAGLLDGGGPLAAIVGLLNRILAILQL